MLPSSTLMMAVPAQIAGCRTVVMATPPRKDGQVTSQKHPLVLSSLQASLIRLELVVHIKRKADCSSFAGDARGSLLRQEGGRHSRAEGRRRAGCCCPGVGN